MITKKCDNENVRVDYRKKVQFERFEELRGEQIQIDNEGTRDVPFLCFIYSGRRCTVLCLVPMK